MNIFMKIMFCWTCENI